MKTSNIIPGQPNAAVAGRVSAVRAASTGITVSDVDGGEVTPAQEVQFSGATVSDLGDNTALVSITGTGDNLVVSGSVAVEYGDVVVLASDGTVTTTTTAQDTRPVGIVQLGGNVGDTVSVIFSGFVAQVNCTASVTAGNYGETSTTAGDAEEFASLRTGSFCQFLATSATPSAYLFGATTTASPGTGLPWFNVVDYGATGDGTTDDTATINLAIAAMNAATRGVLYFPAGTYKTTAGLTAVTAEGTVLGDGSRGDYDGPVSLVTCTSTTAVLFSNQSRYLRFEKIAMQNTAAGTVTAGAGIQVVASDGYQRTMVADVVIHWFYDGIDSQGGTNWAWRDLMVMDAWRYGVRIRNTVQPDAGNWLIDKLSVLNNGVHATTAGIRIESSGSARVMNYECLGAIGFNHYGIDIVGDGSTSVMHVINASIESYGNDGIRSVGDWPFQTFTNIEFGQYGNTTGHGMNLSGGREVAIDNIAATATPGAPVALAFSGMTGLHVGQITNLGFAALTSGTIDHDGTGGVGNEVFIDGTPSAGQVPIATSGTAAAWASGATLGPSKGTPATSYGTPAAGAATTYIGTGATISKPTAPDVDFSADVTNNNVTSTAHGLAPKSPADATKFLNGAATPAFALVKDSDLSTTDITTNDVTTSKHGFAPKAPNDATKYLDGTGAYSVPTGSGSSTTDHEHIGNLTFNGDGATTVFELPAASFDAYSYAAYVAGVRVGATLSGAMLTVLTFDIAPASGTGNITVDLAAAVA